MSEIIKEGKHEIPLDLYGQIAPLVHVYGLELVVAAARHSNKVLRQVSKKPRGRPPGSAKDFYWALFYMAALMEFEGLSLTKAATRAAEAYIKHSGEAGYPDDTRVALLKERKKKHTWPPPVFEIAFDVFKNNKEALLKFLYKNTGRPYDECIVVVPPKKEGKKPE